jgi:hypothetical protein
LSRLVYRNDEKKLGKRKGSKNPENFVDEPVLGPCEREKIFVYGGPDTDTVGYGAASEELDGAAALGFGDESVFESGGVVGGGGEAR